MVIIKKEIIFLFIVCLFCSCNENRIAFKDSSMINYDLMVNDSLQAVVLLEEPIYKRLDTSKLTIVADSLFKNRHQPITISNYNYSVWFYYRKDWKGKIYYAGKLWSYNYEIHSLKPGNLDVKGITGNDKQDEINALSTNQPIKSQFDTITYLKKIKGLSKEKMNQLVKLQIDSCGSVKSFVELCKHQLDSAKIITDGNDNYTYLYHNHFINVWGNISYPITKNNFTYSMIVSFEGVYDIFGNQVFFKSHFGK